MFARCSNLIQSRDFFHRSTLAWVPEILNEGKGGCCDIDHVTHWVFIGLKIMGLAPWHGNWSFSVAVVQVVGFCYNVALKEEICSIERV